MGAGQGANIVHEIPAEKPANIDPLVFCPRGIFVVETKPWSKPQDVWEMNFERRAHAYPDPRAGYGKPGARGAEVWVINAKE